MGEVDVPVVVVGAGPAGLATSRSLGTLGIEHLVLERGERVGHTWENLYDSLTLHTGKHLSALPGMRFPENTPLFPRRSDFVAYLESYAARFMLPVRTRLNVTRICRDADSWRTESNAGTFSSRIVVVATGIVANPVVPSLPGTASFTGSIMHSSHYRNPAPFLGRSVLVVGCGNSGGEIASELASEDVEVTIAVRSGVDVVPLTLLGIPIQYASWLLTALPPRSRTVIAEIVQRISARRRGISPIPRSPHPPLSRVPLIGFHLVDAIRSGRVTLRPGIESLTATGARFADGSAGSFDAVILATGYAPAVALVEPNLRLDDRGFALRSDRISSADHPDLYFVGHNYDVTGGLYNIARDGPLAARAIGRRLKAGGLSRPAAPG